MVFGDGNPERRTDSAVQWWEMGGNRINGVTLRPRTLWMENIEWRERQGRRRAGLPISSVWYFGSQISKTCPCQIAAICFEYRCGLALRQRLLLYHFTKRKKMYVRARGGQIEFREGERVRRERKEQFSAGVWNSRNAASVRLQ